MIRSGMGLLYGSVLMSHPECATPPMVRTSTLPWALTLTPENSAAASASIAWGFLRWIMGRRGGWNERLGGWDERRGVEEGGKALLYWAALPFGVSLGLFVAVTCLLAAR